MTVIPEYIIYEYLKRIIIDLKKSIDDDNTQNKTENLIYNILGDTVIGDYNMKDEAIAFFSQDITKRVPFEYKIGYVVYEAQLETPMVCIYMPNEEESMKTLGQVDVSDMEDDNSIERVKYYKTRYAIQIIHPNADLVVMIYRVLQAMFMLYQDEMENMGMIEISLGGADLIAQTGVEIPVNLYSKLLYIDFTYKSSIPIEYYNANAESLKGGVQSLKLPLLSYKRLMFDSPYGDGKQIENGEDYNIRWSSLGDIRFVNIYLRKINQDVNGEYVKIADEIKNELGFVWSVDIDEEELGDYQLKITEVDNETEVYCESSIFEIT